MFSSLQMNGSYCVQVLVMINNNCIPSKYEYSCFIKQLYLGSNTTMDIILKLEKTYSHMNTYTNK